MKRYIHAKSNSLDPEGSATYTVKYISIPSNLRSDLNQIYRTRDGQQEYSKHSQKFTADTSSFEDFADGLYLSNSRLKVPSDIVSWEEYFDLLDSLEYGYDKNELGQYSVDLDCSPYIMTQISQISDNGTKILYSRKFN